MIQIAYYGMVQSVSDIDLVVLSRPFAALADYWHLRSAINPRRRTPFQWFFETYCRVRTMINSLRRGSCGAEKLGIALGAVT